ncbi:LOW QUALITY PROTEIN: Na(+) H(+) antiporter subunit G [Bacillus sp. JCM 19047]|nr:LOW QUALITY PROTEIN: Na(+) H(+) antiporter subunit G [Bacillus sp. JCM 19047]
MTAIEWIIIIFLAVGTLFSIAAGIGLVRFPDVYSRLHATGKNATASVILIMSATFIYFLYEHQLFIGKILLTILFVFLTTPVAALLISRSAYRIGIPMSKESVRDEMKPYYDNEKASPAKNEEQPPWNITRCPRGFSLYAIDRFSRPLSLHCCLTLK